MRHQDRIYSYIVALVPNRADADDLFQEVGLVLWRKFEEFTPGTQFQAWACRIALNKVMNHRKRMSRSPLKFCDEFIDVVAREHVAKSDLWEDRNRALIGCLQRLADDDRLLLRRCYQPDTTVLEVANELQKKADTLYKRLSRLRKRLLSCIARATSGNIQ
jgi:RNA polymerase sigma-70 factor (ECF subfamily)